MGILQVLRLEFQKFWTLEILNFPVIYLHMKYLPYLHKREVTCKIVIKLFLLVIIDVNVLIERSIKERVNRNEARWVEDGFEPLHC